MAALSATVVVGVLYTGTRADAERTPVSHTVAPGDTLWSIVTDHYPPSEDPRIVIEDIRRVNGLQSYRIHPGERLNLPSAQP